MDELKMEVDKFITHTWILVALMAAGLLLVLIATGNAIDHSIDNQNVMLCKSAERSGNYEYLTKCAKYYETGSIEYMRAL